jgi:isopentenyl phosphate kinase
MIGFLKLGGSLITEKSRPRTPRLDVIKRLAEEIAAARHADPALRLLLGHGSGSFGHVPAAKYGTRQGVRTPQEWLGFIEVWRDAAALNRLVMDALAEAGLPALSFPPSGSATAESGAIAAWDIGPLRSGLQAGLLPVVYGDVVFDRARGGTILSTEDLFAYLARLLKPSRLLLAGLEPGVWADYPACTHLLSEITQQSLVDLTVMLDGSAATDVTGGMASKVQQSLDLALEVPGLEVSIFSGERPGVLLRALAGERVGTLIHA